MRGEYLQHLQQLNNNSSGSKLYYSPVAAGGGKRNVFMNGNNRSYINNSNNTGQLSSTAGMKLNEFKKTYLNLDSKLNKTTKK